MDETTIVDFIKLIHMDTCFEVAKSKTNLVVADWEIALYDCYCFQPIA